MRMSDRFIEALEYATRKHASQRRKGTAIPYVAHLLGVTSIALEQGATEDEAIAALLHDAVEDQGGAPTREEIRERFGEGVAAIVDGCSDTDVEPKPPWRARKEAYLGHLRSVSPSVCLVSAADKLHNLRAIVAVYRELGEALWQRFNARRDDQLWFYREFAAVLRARNLQPRLTAELERTLSELERLVAKADGRPGEGR